MPENVRRNPDFLKVVPDVSSLIRAAVDEIVFAAEAAIR